MKKIIVSIMLGLGTVGVSYSASYTVPSCHTQATTVTCGHCGEHNVVRPQFCNRCATRLDTSPIDRSPAIAYMPVTRTYTSHTPEQIVPACHTCDRR